MKMLLFIAAPVVFLTSILSPGSAQTVDSAAAAQAGMEKAVTDMGIPSKSSAAAHDKADAAMTTPNSSATEADRNAAAAMSK
ncbi:MAG: hypothetical protein JO081_14830 [Alphaproteobacteria bacterium]|nr:hypothetical protein [Alphaproteobacteria bacterium]